MAPELDQQHEAEAQQTLDSGNGWDLPPRMQEAPSRNYLLGTTHKLRRQRGSIGPESSQHYFVAPELDVGKDNFFYDNLELVLSDSENEEEEAEEFHVDDGGRQASIAVDQNSIRDIFQKETWSQCSNEYATRVLPFIGNTLGVKKTYHRMPSFLHLFGCFWTRSILKNICIEAN